MVVIGLGAAAACATTAPCPPGAAAAAPPPKAPRSPLEWDADLRFIRCRATGTEIAVPEAWRPHVRRAGPDRAEIQLTGGPTEAAVLIVATATADPAKDFLRDWSNLHRLLPPPTVQPADIESSLDTQATDNRIVARYAAGGDTYRLGYTLSRANDASCRFATLERAPRDDDSSLVEAL